MKVILNVDVKHLGEEGDVKDVANGYARNYLFPRSLAVPYNDVTLAHFEGRRAEIEARKEEKRKAAAGLKERLEGTTLTINMSAGANGKLYGAVTNQTIADELAKLGFEVERKRIEVPGLTLKSVGKYTVVIHLYETATADVPVIIEAQVGKDAKETPKKTGAAKKADAEEAAAATEEAAAPDESSTVADEPVAEAATEEAAEETAEEAAPASDTAEDSEEADA